MPYRADSIVAWDSRLGRLTVMTPAGEHGRTIAVGRGTGVGSGGAAAGGPAAFLSVIGPLANGGFIARRGILSAVPGDTTAVRRDMFTYVQLGPEGSIERELVTLPDDEQFVWADGGSRSVRGRAFGRTTSVDVRGMTVAWASNDGFRATTLDLGTGARSTLETNVEPAPVRESDRRRWRQENGPPADMPPAFRANLSAAADAMIFPELMPWHGGLVIADDDAIWLEHYPAAGTRPVWTVLAPGSPPRSIRFPVGFRLTDVSGGLACGITVGELDVQRVTVVRLPGG
jgi:hypothetical protein